MSQSRRQLSDIGQVLIIGGNCTGILRLNTPDVGASARKGTEIVTTSKVMAL